MKINRGELARKYFLEGYNCSQAIILAFKDVLPGDIDSILKMAVPFGGGISRLRKTCGAFSAIVMILGLLEGYTTNETGEVKQKLYEKVQNLANKFEEKNGSIDCFALLKIPNQKQDSIPSERTSEYYKKRPCPDIIANAADILEEYLFK